MSRFASILVTGLIVVSTAVAAPPNHIHPDNLAAQTAATDYTSYINANRILMFVSNRGVYARDVAFVFGRDEGFYFPYTSIADIENGTNDHTLLYAAGIWLGGMVHDSVRVTVAEYSTEFVPGPMSSGTFLPDNPSFRVYKLYADSLASNPNQDYIDWPYDQGAPWKLDAGGDTIPDMRGSQMTWSVFNDADPSQHNSWAGKTPPLGIEVQQTTFAYSSASTLGNIIFVQYKLYNRGYNDIDSFHITLWSDPDLGGAQDDLVGCDTIKQHFFCYNADNDDYQYGATPPAVGGVILFGPIEPAPGSTAFFDRQAVPDYRNALMSSFTKYIGGADPDTCTATFGLMTGKQVNGQPYVYNGDTVMFTSSGDPVLGTGYLDTTPGELRMVPSFGPFSFTPGDSQQVMYALAAGQSVNRLASLTSLRACFDYAAYVSTPPTLKAAIEPDTIFCASAHTAEPQAVGVVVGYQSFYRRGLDLDPSGTVLTGLGTVDSVTVSPSHAGFNGEVINVYFSLPAFLESLGMVWDTLSLPFTVDGNYMGGGPFSTDGEVTVVGERLGDFDNNGVFTISDITYGAGYLYAGFPEPANPMLGDLNYDGIVDMADLSLLVDAMFR